MALDKQRILSDLGNVMNQLKSADCGCMGKLFSNHGQSNTAMPNSSQANAGFRHGCCHGHGCGHNCGHGHGYTAPCAGEPYSAMNPHTMSQQPRHCMGQCNPPELYANTYNYLNKNLMQPVVKEVYNDLKGISPANTVTHNPIGNLMGLSMQDNDGTIANDGMRHDNMMQRGKMPANMNMSINDDVNNNQKMGLMGTMGPQIMNMMMGDGSSKPLSSTEQGEQLRGPMIIDAPQSPHGQVGVTPMTSLIDTDQGQYTGMSQGMYNPGQQAQAQQGSHMQNPTTQYTTQQNMYSVSNAQNLGNLNQAYATSEAQQMGKINPANQQMAAAHSHPYGQHAQGIAKFNEMFPGVMQGLGGDLNFDPMAIAIQMNPANHQQAAMNTMQQIMNGNGMDRALTTAAVMPTIGGANDASANISQANNQTQQNIPPGSQLAHTNKVAPFQQQGALNTGAVVTQPNLMPQQQVSSNNQVPQQQVYTSLTRSPTMNQQQMQTSQLQQQYTSQYQQLPQTSQLQQQQYTTRYQYPPQQQSVDTGAVVTQGTADGPNARTLPQTLSYQPPEQQVLKEPIFPVETSKNQAPPFTKPQQYYEYNTLGQPVEMMPARIYHTPEPNLPQTLSPQPMPPKFKNDRMGYSNVKSTVSKTSLIGNRPVGKTPSRSQLQKVYNQYKGSQSYTQQNIRAPDQGATFSEGNLNVVHGYANQPRQVPIEKVGGDTKANNQVNNNQIENKIGHVGDVPVNNKPQGDVGETLKAPPTKQAKCRNGLQDMVYTSYPTSAAWSFHGKLQPVSTAYRFRRRS